VEEVPRFDLGLLTTPVTGAATDLARAVALDLANDRRWFNR
jgi:hypothetical protein